MSTEDTHFIACNYAEPVSAAAAGAAAYVVTWALGGNLPERMRLVVRSRGGRWIEKWEATRRLRDFRLKTIPPQHPMYGDDRLNATEDHLDRCLRSAAQMATERQS